MDVSLNLSGKSRVELKNKMKYMINKYYMNQAALSQGNTRVTLYGEAARVIEIIAVSTALIIAVAKIAKALQ